MKNLYRNMPDGYQETIQNGVNALRRFSGNMSKGTGSTQDRAAKLQTVLEQAEAIVIGAGAGLSTSAGFFYSGERFTRYFFDFARKYGIQDMYSGGFYPFPDAETRWAWWARHIYYNRYVDAPKPVYEHLLALIKNKNYFVSTTNVDHQFQRAGFDKKRLFYTQGDYGLFQSVNPNIQKTYDNEKWVLEAMAAMGFVRDPNGGYEVPEDRKISMRLPPECIPHCPDDGSDVTMNLRSDDSFVEDEGWHRASAAYSVFLQKNRDRRILFLELGVGTNTPVIIKYPFWQMTLAYPLATYACINYREACNPAEIADRSICIEGDIGDILHWLLR